MFELCHTFKGFIIAVHFLALSCILKPAVLSELILISPTHVVVNLCSN